MADLRTQIFTGTDEHDATAQLETAIEDGSFPVLPVGGVPAAMWMTHRPVIPEEAMRHPYYELHVTAWVEPEKDPVQRVIEAIREGRR